MKFQTKIFEEPHLEFGDKHHHPDPRLGLSEAGPLQIPLGDVIKIAVIGSSKTVEDAKEFFEEAAAGFQGKGEKHPNLHPDFPGLGNRNPFRCKFEIPEGATVTIAQTIPLQDLFGGGHVAEARDLHVVAGGPAVDVERASGRRAGGERDGSERDSV